MKKKKNEKEKKKRKEEEEEESAYYILQLQFYSFLFNRSKTLCNLKIKIS